jgi:uncharacterized repeat protein (TIGR03803 family)
MILARYRTMTELLPRAGLILHNGLFYGTTQAGGTDNNGAVFSLVP